MLELVAELAGCLVAASPGLDCRLVQRLTSTSGAPAQHYVGVLHTLTLDSQVPLVLLQTPCTEMRKPG